MLLTTLAFDRIREAIVCGDLRLGEQVSEAQLAQGLGISKTPVREALVRLKIEGLVEIHPQRGTFVFKPDADSVRQMCSFRATIEIAALREAAEANRNALLTALRTCVENMKAAEAAGDLDRLSRIDMDFHRQFLACCTNAYLRASYDLIRYQLTALRFRSPIDNCVDSHQILIDAIAQDDIKTACRLLGEHVFENEQRYCTACDIA